MKRVVFSRILCELLESCFKPDHKKIESEDRKPTPEEIQQEKEAANLQRIAELKLQQEIEEADRRAVADELGFEIIEPETPPGGNHSNTGVSLRLAHAAVGLESLDEI